MAAVDTGKAIGEFVQAIGKEGAFALGTLLGCMVSAAMLWITSRENRERLKIEFEREKELRGQLQLKDDRITKLHEELEKMIKSMKVK